MHFNLNSKVRVRLTSDGRAHYVQHVASFGYLAHRVPKLVEDPTGWSEWQLWELMSIFGALWSFGSATIPFETEIDIPTTTTEPFYVHPSVAALARGCNRLIELD